ncbi:hypothetical protein Tco_0393585 [Tanacetum coccineum]
MPRTEVIDISSNESSPIQTNLINTTLDTTLALTIPSPITSQAISTQGIDVSPLAPRALVYSTTTSSPLEPHPYLTSLENLPPRSSNPSPPSSSLGFSQTLPQQTPMDFEPPIPLINLSRAAIQNAQNVQNSLLPSFTTTSSQMPPIPPLFHFTTTSTTSIPPFKTSIPPSSTFVPLDQSLWMEVKGSLAQRELHFEMVEEGFVLEIEEIRALGAKGDANGSTMFGIGGGIVIWSCCVEEQALEAIVVFECENRMYREDLQVVKGKEDVSQALNL